jgi:HSP20 family molecular chaperone IbpA
MVAFNSTVEIERKEGDFPRPVLDGVYLTRFDTYETEKEWIFRCRMPDVQLVQVKTVMHHGELVIFGKVRLGLEVMVPDTTSRPLCFYRSFPISGEGNIDQLSVNFKHGVLTVRLPKADFEAHGLT